MRRFIPDIGLRGVERESREVVKNFNIGWGEVFDIP